MAESGVGSRVRRALDGAPVTRAIIVANVAVYLALLASSQSAAGLFGTMPMRTMVAFGANVQELTVLDHHVETLVTSCFLHFSLLHIGFNMYALAQVGPFVERNVGAGRFAPMYLLSGIAGSAASAGFWFLRRATEASAVSAGASGAICGVVGAAMILGVRAQGWNGPLARSMARWLGTILIFGFIAKFDNAAHIGGALAGALLASLWKRGVQYGPVARGIAVGACVLVCVLAAATVAARTM